MKILIFAQHRTGSTWLLNLLGSAKGMVAFPDEMNLYDYRLNSFDKLYRLFGERLQRYYPLNRLHGTFWRKYVTPRVVENAIKELPARHSCVDLALAIIEDYRCGNKFIVAKYVSHLRKIHLFCHRADTCCVVLRRNINDIVTSKLNDESSIRRMNRLGIFGGIYRKILIFYFALEHRYYRKLPSNVLLIDYESLVCDTDRELSRISSHFNLAINSVDRGMSGKSSTSKLHLSKPLSRTEKYFIKFLSNARRAT